MMYLHFLPGGELESEVPSLTEGSYSDSLRGLPPHQWLSGLQKVEVNVPWIA
jgi:hypothetical protein